MRNFSPTLELIPQYPTSLIQEKHIVERGADYPAKGEDRSLAPHVETPEQVQDRVCLEGRNHKICPWAGMGKKVSKIHLFLNPSTKKSVLYYCICILRYFLKVSSPSLSLGFLRSDRFVQTPVLSG